MKKSQFFIAIIMLIGCINIHSQELTTIKESNKSEELSDFEHHFNKISKKYQDDYMNARCDELLPMLDKNLVIFENGEHWPYDKVKEFCPHLPVKPVISTDRSYKILSDDMVYEFVSQMYKSKTGNTVNETQAMIWKYSNENWNIINYDISRNFIKTDD